MDDLVYSAVAIANEFLRRARESYRVLSATQLHELVYCAQGWHLVVAGVPLISSPIAADRGGVYISDLKLAGCWGASPVAGLLHERDDASTFPRVEDGTPARFTIDHVWDDYGPLSRYDLTRLTLAPKGPWDQVWNVDEHAEHASVLIPNRLLREWFGQVATWRTAADRLSIAVDRLLEEHRNRESVLASDRDAHASVRAGPRPIHLL
jgi:uncharacterized phage-associated protein